MSEITMFSTPWCGYCKRLKLQMKNEGIAFVEVDISEDPASEAFVIDVNRGDATVPTLLFPDHSVLTNPTLAQVKNQLAGAHPTS
jgi:mycoredoxin